MQDRIEPPILVSRLMTLVMATALVVLVVLIITLDRMFPLNRPQVFFLRSQTLENKELTLTDMPDSLETYKKQFLREYVRERNEVTGDINAMHKKWSNTTDGVIRMRSTKEVYNDFGKTDLVNLMYQDIAESLNIECTVSFSNSDPLLEDTTPGRQDTYFVPFAYNCVYGDDGTFSKRYTVRIKLQSTENKAVKWSERMENPLGFLVSEYTVVRGGQPVDDEPLNWIRTIDTSNNRVTQGQFE